MKFEIKGIFVKTLLIILAMSFVLFGIVNFFSGVGQTTILKIGDDEINVNKFSKFLNERRSQYYTSEMSEEQLDFLNSENFKNIALSEFVKETLFQKEIRDLNIKQPKESVLNEIYNDKNFANKNGVFDVNVFKDLLAKNQLSEEQYLNYISSFNSRNTFLQILLSQNLINNYIVKPMSKLQNKYLLVDIVKIKPRDLTLQVKNPSNGEIEEYYEKNKNDFLIPEEKVISYIDVDLGKYNKEEAKTKLSQLEDLVLSSNNIDEIANLFKVKKNIITYFKGENKNLPKDLNSDILQYGVGTFSDLIYKENNIYKVYFIEKILPSKILSLNEAKSKIRNILFEQAKKENEDFMLNKLVTQIKNNNLDMVVMRNGLELLKDQEIYKNNTNYPINFVNALYDLNSKKNMTKPIFDNNKNVYYIALLRDIKEFNENDNKFMSDEDLKLILKRSYSNSIANLFEKYLLNTNKIIVNNELFDSL